MRCPKCGFNSFDHNLNCPKCRKDLSSTRKLLNLSIPAPGIINFFHTAEERSIYPEPFIEIEPEIEVGIQPLGEAETLLPEYDIDPSPVEIEQTEILPAETIENNQTISELADIEVVLETDDIEPVIEIDESESDEEPEELETQTSETLYPEQIQTAEAVPPEPAAEPPEESEAALENNELRATEEIQAASFDYQASDLEPEVTAAEDIESSEVAPDLRLEAEVPEIEPTDETDFTESLPESETSDDFSTAATAEPEPDVGPEPCLSVEDIEGIEPLEESEGLELREEVEDIEPLEEADEIEPVDELEDIEPEDEIEDIEPEQEADEILPLAASADDEIEEIFPLDDDKEIEDIKPVDDPDDFAAHLAQAVSQLSALKNIQSDEDTTDEEELGDLDDLELIEEITPTEETTIIIPPGSQAAMDQIKNTLAATGDLNPLSIEEQTTQPNETEIQLDAFDPDIDEIEEIEPLDIENAPECLSTQPAESPAARPVTEAPLEPAPRILTMAADATRPIIAPEQDEEGADLSDLAEDLKKLDVENLDKKI